GARQGWSSEESKASDALVQAFVRVEKQRTEADSLRPVAVYDPAVASKLEELERKIESNMQVLSRLETTCTQLGMNDSFSITGLKQRTMELREEARYLQVNYSQDLDPYLQLEAGLGASAAGLHKQHPKVIEMTSTMDAKRAAIQKKVASINEKIDCLEAILIDFRW
ncbi:MAG: hypothetical protein ABR985_11365, partial [Methanotrichaceae archaeon]